MVREIEQKQSKKKKAKGAKNVLDSAPQLFKVTAENVKEYLGKPIFTSDRFYERTPVGVCMGLAWTAMGGATLYIEAIKVPAEKTEMKLTGQAGRGDERVLRNCVELSP